MIDNLMAFGRLVIRQILGRIDIVIPRLTRQVRGEVTPPAPRLLAHRGRIRRRFLVFPGLVAVVRLRRRGLLAGSQVQQRLPLLDFAPGLHLRTVVGQVPHQQPLQLQNAPFGLPQPRDKFLVGR